MPKKSNAKEWSKFYTVVFITHVSKVILKIHQARLQQYMNQELPDVQAGFGKGRGARDQIANINWIIEKVRDCHKKKKKTLTFAPLTMLKPLCGSQQTMEYS